MNVDDLFDAGEDILNTVNKAVNSKNYSHLGDEIESRVRTAMDEFRQEAARQAAKNSSSARNHSSSHTSQKSSSGSRQSAGSQGGFSDNLKKENKYWEDYQRSMREEMERKRKTAKHYSSETGYKASYGTSASSSNTTGAQSSAGKAQIIDPSSTFLQTRIDRDAGMIPVVLGKVGAAVGGAGAAVSGLLLGVTALFGHLMAAPIVSLVFCGGLLGASLWGIKSGQDTKQLVQRYYQYAKQIGSREYINIPDFCARIGRSEKDFRKDISTMIDRGYLLTAHYDKQENTLMLTDHAYDQYQQAEQSRIARETDAEKKKEEERRKYEGVSEEVAEILREGNSYITEIHRINDLIPDEQQMSDKLYRLEDTMKKIFAQVHKDPNTAPRLRRMMNYYLPTTKKLLNAYVDLDKNAVSASDTADSKKEIENAIDMLCDAFDQLLNSLFQNQAWDISSDVSVMETMLNQDGFDVKKPNQEEITNV